MASRARRAARPFNASSTPRTRRTTARGARRAAGSSPTARSRGCSGRTGRGRSRSSKSDRLAVWRRARGPIPLVLPREELVLRDEALVGDDLLERGEPVMVVAAAVVHLAARAPPRDFVGQVSRPLLPREAAALGQRHGHAEGLG